MMGVFTIKASEAHVEGMRQLYALDQMDLEGLGRAQSMAQHSGRRAWVAC